MKIYNGSEAEKFFIYKSFKSLKWAKGENKIKNILKECFCFHPFYAIVFFFVFKNDGLIFVEYNFFSAVIPHGI